MKQNTKLLMLGVGAAGALPFILELPQNIKGGAEALGSHTAKWSEKAPISMALLTVGTVMVVVPMIKKAMK